VLAAGYPLLARSTYRGSAEVHATIEILGGLIGLLAGAGFIGRFYSLGYRFHLLVGLAFFVNGAEDLVHGLLGFASTQAWIELPTRALHNAIPATYVSGRVLMASLLILSPFLPAWMGKPRSPRHETAWTSLIVLILSAAGTALAFRIPLPDLIFPTHLISRPLDLASAVLFFVALLLFLWEYRRTRDKVTWWLALAIGVNVIGQIMMSFSKGLYDAFFDAAHVYKVLAYAIPLLGLSLYQTATILELKRAQEAAEDHLRHMNALLRVSMHVLAARKPDQVLERVVEGARQMTNARLALAAHKDAGGAFRIGAVSRAPDAAPRLPQEDLPEAMGDVYLGLMRGGESLRLTVDELRHHPELRNHPEFHAPLGGLLASRLVGADGQANGLVVATDKDTGRFTAEDEALITQIAALASLALQNIAAEGDAERRARELDAVLDSMAEVVVVHDVEGRYVRINRACRRFLGTDVTGLTWQQAGVFRRFAVRHPDGRPIADEERPALRALRGETVWDEPLVFTDAERREVVLAVSSAPITVGAEITGAVTVYHDITKQKQAEQELVKHREHLAELVAERTAELAHANAELSRAKDAAEAASRAKSTFLANMSHEIRTPLNAIIGMTELVLKSQISTRQREFLSTVRDSGEALLSVINDILDFSKIEAGRLVLDHEPFDLRESVGDTMKSFALRAHQQGLELACCIHPDVPRMVVGDYNRLRQIVVNLVGNAIKFTERGEVVLEMAVASLSAEEVVLQATVSDTGIGIPQEKQAAVFEMFEQADSSTTRRHGGTGLGLAIASRLVSLMDGRIWVESEVGRGSRFQFTVRLALAQPQAAATVIPEPAVLHGVRVLVVDDNATNRRILDEILRSWMMVPATACSAEEALRLLREGREAGNPYPLVLTDAHMARTDGFALAEAIKRDAGIASTVVMMLTSGDRPEDSLRCEQLGIVAYLLKPIKQSELLEAIDVALGISTPPRTKTSPVERRPRRAGSLRLLLAEDSLVNQSLAVALLEGEGHTVTVAGNGIEALAAVESQAFDLVLMDVQMPELDGLEATARIRARERQAGGHLPIVAMTARALKGDRERCLEAGMDGYIAKPIRANELFEVIDALVASAPESNASPPPATEQDTVNWSEALSAMRGEPALLRTVVGAALEEVPRLMAAITEAVAARDATRARLAAHTLRSSIRYFGVAQAVQLAQEIETLGGTDNLASAAELVPCLQEQIGRLVTSLSAYLRGTCEPSGLSS
jgi:PAS domain S-box-containing protein